MKCGYVAVLGKSNAGKSSLVNYLVGEDVAIVSHRHQTTRDSILGIKNGKNYQIIFIDTPGVHHSKNQLDKIMNKSVRSAVASADVVLYLADGSKEIGQEELEYIENLQKKCEKMLILFTKSDKKQVSQKIKGMNISVLNGENLNELITKIVELLPDGQPIFDEELYTDKSVSFLIAEKVRGILLDKIDKEIPHGIAVQIVNFVETENLIKIDIDIICEREQHKGIIIGKGGRLLKEIGQKTREYAENLLEKQCLIKLFVKVDKDWRDKNVSAYYNS